MRQQTSRNVHFVHPTNNPYDATITILLIFYAAVSAVNSNSCLRNHHLNQGTTVPRWPPWLPFGSYKIPKNCVNYNTTTTMIVIVITTDQNFVIPWGTNWSHISQSNKILLWMWTKRFGSCISYHLASSSNAGAVYWKLPVNSFPWIQHWKWMSQLLRSAMSYARVITNIAPFNNSFFSCI